MLLDREQVRVPASRIFGPDGFSAPSAEPQGWVRTFVWQRPDGPEQRLAFTSDGAVVSTTSFSAGAIELVIPAGASVGIAGDDVVIRAEDDPITFGPAGAPAMPVRGGVTVAMSPQERGRLTFSAELAAGDPSVPSIRYYYGEQRTIYPIFASATTLVGVVDPLGGAGSLNVADGGVPSTFRTTGGTPLSLVAGSGSQIVFARDPVDGTNYAQCAGTWGLTPGAGAPTGPTATFDLMPGLSGLEFFRVLRAGAVVEFSPGCSAYAPNASGQFGRLGSTGPTAGGAYTTTWLGFASGADPLAGYYEQPNSNGYFLPGATLLPAFQVRAAELPIDVAFPIAPYAGVTGPASMVDQVTAFERNVLTRVRTGTIAPGATASPAGPTGATCQAGASGATGPSGAAGQTGAGSSFPGPFGPTGATVGVVTTQGEQAIFADAPPPNDTWIGLQLAQTSSGQQLVVSDISGSVRTALLNQQLFLVVTNPLALENLASARYRLDAPAFDRLFCLPANVIANLKAALTDLVFWDWEHFEPALQDVLGADFETYQFAVRYAAEYAQLDIASWTFDLSPLRWKTSPFSSTTNAMSPTILILKFCAGALQDLAGDTSLWTLPGYFNDDAATAQSDLGALIAAQLAVGDPPFVEAATSAAWNGVLYLNCNVPTAEFPPALRGLAAGIDGPNLTASYFGIAGAPLMLADWGALIVQNAPLFARIDYSNEVDLVYSGSPFDFRVLELHVRFENSHVVAFASQVELLIGEFFGERSTITNGDRGDNIIFIGTWQQHDGSDTYSFAYSGQNTFAMDTSAVLETVELTSASFVTLAQADDFDPIVSRFTISGTLSFRIVSYADSSGNVADYDVFSYDRLDFGNVVVTMTYDPSQNPPLRKFVFDPAGTTFAGSSIARPGSLCDRLPSQPKAIVQSGGTAGGASTPATLGYMTLITPLGGDGIGDTWYGLELDVQLGSAGGLGSIVPMTGSLMLAWSPVDDSSLDVQVGLRLPGAGSAQQYVTILGPLRLNVATVALKQNAEGSWLLRAIDVTLQLFSAKFPPNGQIKLEIVTDPNPSGHALGWYGAYQKNPASGGDDAGGGDGHAVLSGDGSGVLAKNGNGAIGSGGAPALTRTARLRIAALQERDR
ncbi:MAG TPA: hypothetical protein VGC72_17200 [Candidatus Elarobacter sp.]